MIICDYEIDYINKNDPSDTLRERGTTIDSRLHGLFQYIKSIVWEQNCNGYQLDTMQLSIEHCNPKGERIKR